MKKALDYYLDFYRIYSKAGQSFWFNSLPRHRDFNIYIISFDLKKYTQIIPEVKVEQTEESKLQYKFIKDTEALRKFKVFGTKYR